MNWVKRQNDTVETVSGDSAKAYEQTKAEYLPVAEKESNSGAKAFEQIQFQSVLSPGIYEAEFGTKGKDLLFHFWPWGYHEAERARRALPRFLVVFEEAFRGAMESVFGAHRVEVAHDPDIGAWFCKAIGWGEHQFSRDLAIKACEDLHQRLGGTS
jgi:flavodoxin